MPMNAVDRMLSDAADVVQTRLDEDAVTKVQTAALLDGGQHPTVVRELPGMGALVTIVIAKP